MLKFNNLKECRKILQLNQSALSGIGISREYISDVERGKSKLTPEKAKYIINKLMFISLTNNKKIPLESNNIDFRLIGLANIFECYSFLINENKYNSSCNYLYVDQLHVLSNKPLKDYLFFVHLKLAKEYEKINLKKKAYTYMKLALDIAFNSSKELDLFNIDSNLRLFRNLSYDTLNGSDIIEYYKKLINYYKEKGKEIPYFTYYNLALFEKIDSQYEDSFVHLKLELENKKYITKKDWLDLIIMKASLFFKLGNYNEGISLYSDIITNNFHTLDFECQTLVSSNTVFFIVNCKIKNQDNLLNKCSGFLIKSIMDNPTLFEKRHRVFANLALYFKYIQDENTALDYFINSFKRYFNCYNYINNEYIILLEESFSVYYNSQIWNEYLIYAIKPIKEKMTRNSENKYLRIISNILYKDLNRDNMYIQEFINYIGYDI